MSRGVLCNLYGKVEARSFYLGFLFRFLACMLLLGRAVISSACAVAVCPTSGSGESEGLTTVNKRIPPLPLTGLAGAAFRACPPFGVWEAAL